MWAGASSCSASRSARTVAFFGRALGVLLPVVARRSTGSNINTNISTYNPTAVASKPCGSAKPAKDGRGPSGWPKSR